MSDEIFKALRAGYIAEMDPSLQDDIANAIVSRCKALDFDILHVFEKFARQMQWLEVNNNSAPAYDDIFRAFIMHFCLIVKFMYPMIEQLETAITEKVQLIYEEQD